jgi:hypothetical protein
MFKIILTKTNKLVSYTLLISLLNFIFVDTTESMENPSTDAKSNICEILKKEGINCKFCSKIKTFTWEDINDQKSVDKNIKLTLKKDDDYERIDQKYSKSFTCLGCYKNLMLRECCISDLILNIIKNFELPPQNLQISQVKEVVNYEDPKRVELEKKDRTLTEWVNDNSTSILSYYLLTQIIKNQNLSQLLKPIEPFFVCNKELKTQNVTDPKGFLWKKVDSSMEELLKRRGSRIILKKIPIKHPIEQPIKQILLNLNDKNLHETITDLLSFLDNEQLKQTMLQSQITIMQMNQLILKLNSTYDKKIPILRTYINPDEIIKNSDFAMNRAFDSCFYVYDISKKELIQQKVLPTKLFTKILALALNVVMDLCKNYKENNFKEMLQENFNVIVNPWSIELFFSKDRELLKKVLQDPKIETNIIEDQEILNNIDDNIAFFTLILFDHYLEDLREKKYIQSFQFLFSESQYILSGGSINKTLKYLATILNEDLGIIHNNPECIKNYIKSILDKIKTESEKNEKQIKMICNKCKKEIIRQNIKNEEKMSKYYFLLECIENNNKTTYPDKCCELLMVLCENCQKSKYTCPLEISHEKVIQIVNETSDEKRNCCVCLANENQYTISTTHPNVLCSGCYNGVKRTANTCPLCRKSLEECYRPLENIEDQAFKLQTVKKYITSLKKIYDSVKIDNSQLKGLKEGFEVIKNKIENSYEQIYEIWNSKKLKKKWVDNQNPNPIDDQKNSFKQALTKLREKLSSLLTKM